jgi:hypothetical protein
MKYRAFHGDGDADRPQLESESLSVTAAAPYILCTVKSVF